MNAPGQAGGQSISVAVLIIGSLYWDPRTHRKEWRSSRFNLDDWKHVRVARALGALPKLSDAMRRGVVSYSKVRAVTRVATPETEQALLDVALCGMAGDRYQVVVHVDADALVEKSDVPAGTPAASYAPGRPGGVAQMSAGSALGEGNVRRAGSTSLQSRPGGWPATVQP